MHSIWESEFSKQIGFVVFCAQGPPRRLVSPKGQPPMRRPPLPVEGRGLLGAECPGVHVAVPCPHLAGVHCVCALES